MDPAEIAKKSIEISNTYDAIATEIFERAKKLRKENEIGYEEYKQIMDNYYLPLMTYSSKILMDTSNVIIDNMEDYMVDLEKSSKKLKDISSKLEKSEQIFEGIALILASAAAVATFAATPSPATFFAAFSTVSAAIKNISELTDE